MPNIGLGSHHLRPLIAVLVILFLCSPGFALAQTRSGFPMPNVIGLTETEAENRVTSAGRVYGASSAEAVVVDRRPDSRPAGRIIEQLERPGTPMRPFMDDVGGTYGQVTFRVAVSTGPAPAPNFVGSTLADARRLARQREVILDVGASERNPRVPEGIVVRQDPDAGQAMPGRRVTVYPSAGYPLPNYGEQPVERARRDSRRLGFELEERSADRVDVPRGVVFGQDPPAGTLLPLRGPLRVWVSAGWPVPDLIGRSESEAEDIAAEPGIRLDATRRDNFGIPEGIIFDQQPRAGELLPRDLTIRVTVSDGYPLPGLVGMPVDEARRVASELNFILDDSRREPSADQIAGHIDSQNPGPGTHLPLDRPVRVVVSTGWPTPDLVGKTEQEASGIAAGLDITLIRTEPREHFELSSGLVVEQAPEAGAVLPADRRVRISLSLGWPVAPDAVGHSAESVTRELLARHPNVIVEQSDSLLTLETAGTVISQHPKPKVKLGPRQQLDLVTAAEKPPWVWPVAGVVSLILAAGVFAGLKSALGSSAQQPVKTENPGGVRLRVTKDHGVQTMDIEVGDETDRAGAGEIVSIRVKVDLGEQAASLIEDTGDES